MRRSKDIIFDREIKKLYNLFDMRTSKHPTIKQYCPKCNKVQVFKYNGKPHGKESYKCSVCGKYRTVKTPEWERNNRARIDELNEKKKENIKVIYAIWYYGGKSVKPLLSHRTIAALVNWYGSAVTKVWMQLNKNGDIGEPEMTREKLYEFLEQHNFGERSFKQKIDFYRVAFGDDLAPKKLSREYTKIGVQSSSVILRIKPKESEMPACGLFFMYKKISCAIVTKVFRMGFSKIEYGKRELEKLMNEMTEEKFISLVKIIEMKLNKLNADRLSEQEKYNIRRAISTGEIKKEYINNVVFKLVPNHAELFRQIKCDYLDL